VSIEDKLPPTSLRHLILQHTPYHTPPHSNQVGKMASKTSAVADEPVDVLFALHPKFNLLDFAGPLEVLTTALHDANDKCK
jgi:hypothetical protein